MWWDNDCYRNESQSKVHWAHLTANHTYHQGLSTVRRFLETCKDSKEFGKYITPCAFSGRSQPYFLSFGSPHRGDEFQRNESCVAWVGNEITVVLNMALGLATYEEYSVDTWGDYPPSQWTENDDLSSIIEWLEEEMLPTEDRNSPHLQFNLRWGDEKQLGFRTSDILAVMASIKEWNDYKKEEARRVAEEGLIITKLW
jgi:hypothetical protein